MLALHMIYTIGILGKSRAGRKPHSSCSRVHTIYGATLAGSCCCCCWPKSKRISSWTTTYQLHVLRIRSSVLDMLEQMLLLPLRLLWLLLLFCCCFVSMQADAGLKSASSQCCANCNLRYVPAPGPRIISKTMLLAHLFNMLREVPARSRVWS